MRKLQSDRARPQFADCLSLVNARRVAAQNRMANSFDSKFSHLGAEFPMTLDEDMGWYARAIERTSRVYRAAERKNEPELSLKRKKKELDAKSKTGFLKDDLILL